MTGSKVRSILKRYGEVELIDKYVCSDMYDEPVSEIVSCYEVWPTPEIQEKMDVSEESVVDIVVLRGGRVLISWDRQTTPDEYVEAITKDLRRSGYRVKEICTYRGFPCE